jgi:hypothetical protein
MGEMRNAHKNFSQEIDLESNMGRNIIMRKGLKECLSKYQKFSQIPKGL